MHVRQLFAESEIPDDVADAFSVALRRFQSRPDVIGVAVGPKVKGDEVDWESHSIQIRVREKLPTRLIAPELRIPKKIQGVPTDVLEGGGLQDAERSGGAPATRTAVAATLAPGLSIGVPGGGPGTLGLFVEHSVGKSCILTADHVLAPTGHRDDTRVFQPAPDDDPIEGRSPIARVFKRLPANGVSLATLDTTLGLERQPIGTVHAIRGVRLPRIGDVLEKSGRTSEITRAKVARFGAFRNCKPGIELLPVDGSGTAEISMGGDSGAVWYDPETFEAVAVHCRGDGDGDLRQEWAQAVVLQHVVDALQITI